MANTRRGNTHYIDTGSSNLDTNLNIRVAYLIVTATAASAVVTLQDVSGPTTLIDARVATSGDSKIFDFSRNPMVFPGGLRIGTLTNAVATVITSRAAEINV